MTGPEGGTFIGQLAQDFSGNQWHFKNKKGTVIHQITTKSCYKKLKT